MVCPERWAVRKGYVKREFVGKLFFVIPRPSNIDSVRGGAYHPCPPLCRCNWYKFLNRDMLPWSRLGPFAGFFRGIVKKIFFTGFLAGRDVDEPVKSAEAGQRDRAPRNDGSSPGNPDPGQFRKKPGFPFPAPTGDGKKRNPRRKVIGPTLRDRGAPWRNRPGS